MHLKSVLAASLLLVLSALLVQGKNDDSPGFFLKITKNVPRLGRRSDKEYENYFLNAKHIPRIGRSGEMSSATDDDLAAWLNDIPKPSKRVLMNPAAAAAAAEREYSVVQPVDANTLIELIEKDGLQTEKVKFVHWKDFDRALQLDPDLYAKVISLGRNPDQRLKEDLAYSGYVPVFGNSNDGGADFVFYNKGEKQAYPQGYDWDLLHYNRVRK